MADVHALGEAFLILFEPLMAVFTEKHTCGQPQLPSAPRADERG